MTGIIDTIRELEIEQEKELSQTLIIDGRTAFVKTAKSMADLFLLCYEQNLERITAPQLAKARIGHDSDVAELLWKYNFVTCSDLARVQSQGKDYGVFTHVNVFGTEPNRIQAYARPIRTGGIELTEEEVEFILSKEDGKNVIVVPHQQIKESPRGVISLRDVLQDKGHVIAIGALGNDRNLLEAYIQRYIQIMKKSPFTPLEIGVWFSEDAGKNTMRPIELGDSGVGIYNRNLTNRYYRTIAFKK